jgi:hypothetical protein
MTTRHKNFKSISGGSRNDALPIYILLKIPKSRETVPLTAENSTVGQVLVSLLMYEYIPWHHFPGPRDTYV